MAIVVDIEALETDPEGYLVHIGDWSAEVAEAMALADGCELTDAHWQVIDFLRGYYAEYGFAPAVRILTRAIARRLGPDKGNSRYLYRLFPDGPARQACRYAGLPKPTGCIGPASGFGAGTFQRNHGPLEIEKNLQVADEPTGTGVRYTSRYTRTGATGP